MAHPPCDTRSEVLLRVRTARIKNRDPEHRNAGELDGRLDIANRRLNNSHPWIGRDRNTPSSTIFGGQGSSRFAPPLADYRD